jgi:hypothetical protein
VNHGVKDMGHAVAFREALTITCTFGGDPTAQRYCGVPLGVPLEHLHFCLYIVFVFRMIPRIISNVPPS